uniref:Uncharacterized protein n=1 Tax=Elaeophora elaphi TaxID=1147741 RepID=A0A0R3RMX1_9BILA
MKTGNGDGRKDGNKLELGLELEVMVTTKIHAKSSIIKSLPEDQLISSTTANITNGSAVTTMIRDTDTGNLQGFPSSSSLLMEGHSKVTLKNSQHPATASTMLHCPKATLFWTSSKRNGILRIKVIVVTWFIF